MFSLCVQMCTKGKRSIPPNLQNPKKLLKGDIIGHFYQDVLINSMVWNIDLNHTWFV